MLSKTKEKFVFFFCFILNKDFFTEMKVLYEKQLELAYSFDAEQINDYDHFEYSLLIHRKFLYRHVKIN
jgi:hypothetical protein